MILIGGRQTHFSARCIPGYGDLFISTNAEILDETKMAKVKEMTEGKPLPLILKFSIPLILGNLLQQTYSLIDAAIVGRYLGIDALAAVGASVSITFLILGFCAGCCSGFGIPIAQKFGSRDYSTMRRLVATSMKLSAGLSLGISLITCLLCTSILRWMQTPERIMDDAYAYLLVLFIGIPFSFYYNLLSSIIRALGDSKTPFNFLMLSTILNIVLDLICILVLGWGVAGASIATIVSQGVSAILCFRYMRKKYDILQMTPSEMKFSPVLAKQLMLIGAPMGLQFSITAIGSIMMQSANNALGTACVAAYTAAVRIKMIFLSMLESIGMAMATYCGQNYGAGKPDRIRRGVLDVTKVLAVFVAVVGLILMNLSEDMALLFVDPSEREVLDKTVLFLHITAGFFPLLAILCLLRYSIQGCGYTQLAMFSGVAEMIARTLVSVLAVPIWGYTAVCLGDGSAWICADLFLIPAFIYVYRRLVRIVKHETPATAA